jgi:hypothetical protein
VLAQFWAAAAAKDSATASVLPALACSTLAVAAAAASEEPLPLPPALAMAVAAAWLFAWSKKLLILLRMSSTACASWQCRPCESEQGAQEQRCHATCQTIIRCDPAYLVRALQKDVKCMLRGDHAHPVHNAVSANAVHCQASQVRQPYGTLTAVAVAVATTTHLNWLHPSHPVSRNQGSLGSWESLEAGASCGLAGHLQHTANTACSKHAPCC